MHDFLEAHLRSVTIILSALFVAAAFLVYRNMLRPAVKVNEPVVMRLLPGEHPDVVAHKVAQASGCNVRGFRWLTMFNAAKAREKQDTYRPFRPGNYEIRNGDSMRDIWNRLATGVQTPVRLVVGAPRTLDRLAASLGSQLLADSAAFVAAMTCDSLIEALGYTPQTLPALIIPNTYEVWWTLTPEQFLLRMKRENDRFWKDDRLQKAAKVGLTPVEVATLASIVDEETNQVAEKPIVAGLYLNRLSRGIPLQADPTVKYAVGDPTLRRILNTHLKVQSPYNTYLHKGLPPGPIRIASIQGIDAVLNAQQHNYLYMCASEDFSGYHNFATTLSAHNANARRYQQALNQRGIK